MHQSKYAAANRIDFFSDLFGTVFALPLHHFDFANIFGERRQPLSYIITVYYYNVCCPMLTLRKHRYISQTQVIVGHRPYYRNCG